MSFGDTTCDIVSTFERDDLNDVAPVSSAPACLSWWSVWITNIGLPCAKSTRTGIVSPLASSFLTENSLSPY